MKIRGFIRDKVWEEYRELERNLMFLKTIVQNDVELSIKDLEEHEEYTKHIANRLNILNKLIQTEALKSNDNFK